MNEEKSKSSPLIISDGHKSGSELVRDEPVNAYQLSSIERLSKADPSNVQQIAASQIELLYSYHQEVLNQAKKSFFWALIAAGAGLFLFIGALAFILAPKENQKSEFAIVSVIGGTLIEVISGINFYLYGKAASQMSDFQERLDRTQRFLLANSMCEGLEGDAKNKARSELIEVIAKIGTNSTSINQQQKKIDKL